MICQKKVTVILSVGLALTLSGSIALGFVPEAQLWFDANDNPAHPDGWTNLGTAGGRLIGSKKGVPVLEPNAGPDGGAAYTAKEESQFFGRNAQGLLEPKITPAPRIEDWTIEVWLKRNGPAFDNSEHQFLAIMDSPPRARQGILFLFAQPNNGKIWLRLIGRETGNNPDTVFPPVDIGLREWHHIAFTYDNDKRQLQSYLDGQLAGRPVKLDTKFSPESEMKNNGLFTIEFGKRVLNGSISLVRMYDRPLSHEDILENFESPRTPQAVGPAGKLSTTWSNVKSQY